MGLLALGLFFLFGQVCRGQFVLFQIGLVLLLQLVFDLGVQGIVAFFEFFGHFGDGEGWECFQNFGAFSLAETEVGVEGAFEQLIGFGERQLFFGRGGLGMRHFVRFWH